MASLGLGAGFGAGWLVFLLESCGGEPRWGESAFLRFYPFLGVGVGVFLCFLLCFLVFLGFSRFSWVFLWGWGGAWAKGNVQGRLNKGISSFSSVFLRFCWVFLAWGASSGPSSWALGLGPCVVLRGSGWCPPSFLFLFLLALVLTWFKLCMVLGH